MPQKPKMRRVAVTPNPCPEMLARVDENFRYLIHMDHPLTREQMELLGRMAMEFQDMPGAIRDYFDGRMTTYHGWEENE